MAPIFGVDSPRGRPRLCLCEEEEKCLIKRLDPEVD